MRFRLSARYLALLLISVCVSAIVYLSRVSNRRQESCVWPEDCDDADDRILNQLKLDQTSDHLFKILPPDYNFPVGSELFVKDECLVNRCEITYDHQEADTLVLPNSDVPDEIAQSRRPDQVWIAYLLESPVHTYNPRFKRKHRGVHTFNWTASYRRDSDIVAPYSKFVISTDKKLNSEDRETRWRDASESHKRLIASKTRQVAWFVSNCNAANNRLEYANELSKLIQVDIYGKCGNFTCNKWERSDCLDLIKRDYKFYLSFENSNCREYITEKLYENAYGYNDPDHLVIPIVMGPPKSDYELLVPPESFIHVDDFKSPRDLAKYLKYLNSNESAYYAYFRWKTIGSFVATKFMCRVCAMLHHSFLTGRTPRSIKSVENWWNQYGNEREKLIPSCS